MTLKEYFTRQGRKGGKKRAAILTKAQLREIALKGVWAREQKRREKTQRHRGVQGVAKVA